jgi:hypothetical protein
MASLTPITPEQILARRQKEASSGRLAHSANIHGDFFARYDCICYMCMNSLDPTGEKEAARENRVSHLLPSMTEKGVMEALKNLLAEMILIQGNCASDPEAWEKHQKKIDSMRVTLALFSVT